jgi:FAD/FMN-containing dehydrogenase/Fe-S oxidoreductase
MNLNTALPRFDLLEKELEGDLKYDEVTRLIFSTDASVYKEVPQAVIWPRNASDIRKIVLWASATKTSITMRAAGTSLAGQVVSSGVIVDISKYMNRILEINKDEMWVRVEPGVVLDELNMTLKEHGLFFGPETSTSNRCNIGGMVGNNACGSHSIIYGSTRDHTLELKTVLSDGNEAVFSGIDLETFKLKCSQENLEGKIYRNIKEILDDTGNKANIQKEFPDRKVKRRNTGYALDLLLDSDIFDAGSDRKFNFCNLLAGSEGTLAATTEIKLNIIPLPPVNKAVVCIHLHKRNEAFKANLVALKYKPSAVEMMDNRILELTEDNISQRNNRFFLEGHPEAIVIVEFIRESTEEIDRLSAEMIKDLQKNGYGYAYPIVKGKDIAKVWELRKAGLGILANMKGDAKPVALIEDTAVNPEQMPAYIDDIEKMLASHGKDAVFHAHIGTGELHLRPILDLKKHEDILLFRTIGLETAHIVKKYNGSLSGEHGDGRLRGEFIPIMLGESNYQLLKDLKECWDPDRIFNPGKITDTPQMNESLRYIPGSVTREIDTIYDFSSTEGILRAAEKCNGSADCRKSARIGGIMCPSFMATGDEDKSTRARANVVREYFTLPGDPWDHREIYDVLDLCLGCKGCKAECPSGVDIAKIKSEFLQHWYDKHGIPVRTLAIAYISALNKLGSILPGFYNFFLRNSLTSGIIKGMTGFAAKRSIPLLYRTTLRKWLRKNLAALNPEAPIGDLCLFVDEFTDYNDTETGIAAVKLLTALNYRVLIINHGVSGRTFISKGLVRKAQKIVRSNIISISNEVNDQRPLVGIEPSAILGFRDEYPELAGADLKDRAVKLAANCMMIDEFIAREFKAGKINRNIFTDKKTSVLLHAHCQQKAISSSAFTKEMLSIPVNYSVSEIPSGCCGMAGSFGYEKEHFDFSNMVGELVLFPEVRKANSSDIITAPGTSCRHHIKDGTGRIAMHPAVVLYEALKNKS